jgi:hypothetical protein
MMATQIEDRTMMVREGLLFPESARIESLSYSDTWRTLVGMDSFALDRRLCAAGFHLFFIAGELKVIKLGGGPNAVRRGIKKVLARGRRSNLNCIEITQVRQAHFLGLPWVAIRAYSFHIQNNALLQSDTARKSEQNDSDWACE